MEHNKFEVEVVTPKKELPGIKAFANLKMSLDIGVLVVKDFVVRISSKDGSLWVSAPSKKGKGKDGKDQYFDIAHMVTGEGRKNLHEVILSAVRQKLGEPAKVTPEGDETTSFT